MKYWKTLIGDWPTASGATSHITTPEYFASLTKPVIMAEGVVWSDYGDGITEITKEEYENSIFGKFKDNVNMSFITTTFIDNIRSYATYELLSDPQNTNVEIIKHLQTIQNAMAANDLESEVEDTVWTTVPSQTKNNVLQLIRRYATDADSTWDKAFQFWHQIYTFIKLSTNQGNKDILNQLELANGLLTHGN